MQARLEDIYFKISSSFWFIPLVLSIAALIGSWLTLQLDFSYSAYRLTDWLPGPPVTQEGARLVVSAVAGSMVTAASLVFSMTLVALSFVSQQLGPRIVMGFMEDRPTQIVLGVFVATFVYSLIVLGVIGTRFDANFIPVLSVYVSGFLALLSLALMIHFIHHIATNIQADAVVAALGRQLLSAIEAREQRHAQNSKFIPLSDFESECDDIRERGKAIFTPRSGYIQSIDESGVLSLAEQRGVQVSFIARPGHFVIEGTPIAFVTGLDKESSDQFIADLQGQVVLGERRTRQQHIEFEINALVEVALRALSPSMNDPLTAVACANRIFVGLTKLTGHSGEARVLQSANGSGMVLPLPQDFGHYLDIAIDPLRRSGKNDFILSINLVGLLKDLAIVVDEAADREAIACHIRALQADCEQLFSAKSDKAKLEKATSEALAIAAA